MRPAQGWVFSSFGLVVGLLAVGCGPSQQQTEEESMLKPLAILHGKYAAQHMGNVDEAGFKAYVEKLSDDEKKSLNITDPAKLWISNRDHQPFVVIYGQASGPPGPAGQPVVVYEVEGRDGKRMVGSQLGAVDEVDEARFRELVPSVAAPAP